jgi:hypothetical protein
MLPSSKPLYDSLELMSETKRGSDHRRHWYTLDHTPLLQGRSLILGGSSGLFAICRNLGITRFGEYKDVLGWNDGPFVLIVSCCLLWETPTCLLSKLHGLVGVFVKVDQAGGGLDWDGEV